MILVGLAASCLAEEVEFQCGPDKLYGTLEIPKNFQPGQHLPAVLLLSGSGPTDRDGNSALLKGKTDSHKHLAELLAKNGIITLRYDKLFSGKTGVATHAKDYATIEMSAYVDCSQAAYHCLAACPQVDPKRLMILGHSEGGLIALIQAKEKRPVGLKGLVLAMPLSEPYLKTIYDQIAKQFEVAVKAGNCPQPEADRQLATLAQVMEELKTTKTAPSRDKLAPSLRPVFSPANDSFLGSCANYDPADLAKDLSVPALVLSGTKDGQITRPMVEHLMTGFKNKPQVKWIEFKDVNHVLKEINGTPKPVEDYVNPKKPFSAELDKQLVDWLKKNI